MQNSVFTIFVWEIISDLSEGGSPPPPLHCKNDIFCTEMLTFIIIIMSEDNVTDYSPLHCIF